MIRTLLDNGWKFTLLKENSSLKNVENAEFKDVEIPHDWLIYNANELYKSGDGWYMLELSVNDDEKRRFLEFDGVYMDCTVYVNDKAVCIHRYGYSSFSCEITDELQKGINKVLAQVRFKAPNSRWYSGAGIYRNVYLTEFNKSRISYNGIYISANAENGSVIASAEIDGCFDKVNYKVYDCNGKLLIETSNAEFTVENYKCWSIDKPVLYTLKTELILNNEIVDEREDNFGFRSLLFDADNGFYLNGEYMKIKGVCLHHDLGAIGAEVNRRATERQLLLMKNMGANAVRTSHNMASPEFIDICDKIGLLVNEESFDMWELPKTEYDNARFFKETARDDVLSWVKRDRNHPCIFMWSIGNEIYDTHASEHGFDIAEKLVGFVREADWRNNVPVTIGSNFIEWENAQKIGEFLGLSGYNYTEKCYDEHHKKYPHTVIYGSETSSAVRSRGVYHFPASVPLLSHVDNQCSSLGNSCVGWGRSAEDAWILDRDRKFCAGQFIWTGIDYIGEPTPYNSKNSFFGAADTACFPKDIYYFYQSVWTDKPMLHLLPYWDFNDNQPVDVIAYTNAPSVELFLNGRSCGIRNIDRENGKILHAEWNVPYEKGEITAKAYNEFGDVIACKTQRSFGNPVSIKAEADRYELDSDGRDMCFVKIYTVDKDGIFVANSRSRISVSVNGCGRLVGLDNGDSTDYEQYKCSERRLFSGLLLAMIKSDASSGKIKVVINSEGLIGTELYINVIEASSNIPKHNALIQNFADNHKYEIPIRKIEVKAVDGTVLNENRKSINAIYKIFPENATYNDITCKIVSINSVESCIASAELDKQNRKIKVSAFGDGKAILRVYAANGSEFPQVISDTFISVSGLGNAVRNPYEFISACTFSSSSIKVNMIENGALGGFTEYSKINYDGLDFGKSGSGKFKLFIGNCCNKTIPIEIFVDDKINYTAEFPHNNGWGSFEPLEFALPSKLCGIHTLSFGISDKCIFGGFEFVFINRAFSENIAAECDKIYGDDYCVKNGIIEKIGNNVVVEFSEMDFADGASGVEICGRTPNAVNTVQLRYKYGECSKTQLLEFKQSDKFTRQRFKIDKIFGKTDISFVFMPGSCFDFKSFEFLGE